VGEGRRHRGPSRARSANTRRSACLRRLRWNVVCDNVGTPVAPVRFHTAWRSHEAATALNAAEQKDRLSVAIKDERALVHRSTSMRSGRTTAASPPDQTFSRGHGVSLGGRWPIAWPRGLSPVPLLRRERDNLPHAHRHRAQQARGQQRRVGGVVSPCGERDASGVRSGLALQQPVRPGLDRRAVPLAVRRQLLVPDQAVRPQVRDLHLQLVAGHGR